MATLQKPLPATAPKPLRTEAWSDLQLWTQLGAWAEQRHTWALHTKMTVMVMGMISPPRGIVAPYPDFFSGLAKLTRQTATAFDKAGFGQAFEIKPIAAELLTKLELSEKISASRDEKDGGELCQAGCAPRATDNLRQRSKNVVGENKRLDQDAHQGIQ